AGRLMVRQFEESRRARMALELSVASADYVGGDEVELAVAAAASLGAQAVRDGRDLAVLTGTHIPRVVTGRVRAIQSMAATDVRALLDGFCTVEALAHTSSIEEVARLAGEATVGLSVAFVVFGSQVPLA